MVESFYAIQGAPFLALLSDLHNRDYRPVVESLMRHKPALICVTGDLIDGTAPENDTSPLRVQPRALELLRTCANMAPTFASLGNHEWMLDQEDLHDLSSTGAIVLDNTWVEHDGLVIGGLTSGHAMKYRHMLANLPNEERDERRYASKSNNPRIARMSAMSSMKRTPDVDWLPTFAAMPGYHILLSHHPEYYPLVPNGVELVLSGHAHGGQWRIFGHGVFAPGQGLWPRLTKGVYDKRLVISAGLSNTAPVPRIFNPIEIVYVKDHV